MIQITKENNRITVVGHAQYAEPGKDIVCAGVTALVQTLGASCEAVGAYGLVINEAKGMFALEVAEHTSETRLLFNSFMIGAELIQNEFPEYVQATEL